MGKLKRITFAGLDDHATGTRESTERLARLQREYPEAEYGVLLSMQWLDGGPRYPDPMNLARLRGAGLRLCACLRGETARDALLDDWHTYQMLTGPNGDLFARAQLDVTPCDGLPFLTRKLSYAGRFGSVCLRQEQGRTDMFEKMKAANGNMDILIDRGGTGRAFTAYPHTFTGYAGNMNPDNVAATAAALAGDSETGDFWIELEDGIRDENDRFDTGKAERTLRNLRERGLI